MDSDSVSLGNIPFDFTEERVMEIAKSVGPVVSLKLLFDQMTGKSKGNALVTYGDKETAASAVRNLNNMPLGNRLLRCSFATDTGANDTDKLPPLPLGVQIYPNQTAPQVISGILSNLNSESASQIVKEAKEMSLENPKLMETLLDRYPQLSHALVEITLLLNLASRDTIELTLNKKQPVLYNLTPDHINLLKDINTLTEAELSLLDEDKRTVVEEVVREFKNGSYGKIL